MCIVKPIEKKRTNENYIISRGSLKNIYGPTIRLSDRGQNEIICYDTGVLIKNTFNSEKNISFYNNFGDKVITYKTPVLHEIRVIPCNYGVYVYQLFGSVGEHDLFSYNGNRIITAYSKKDFGDEIENHQREILNVPYSNTAKGFNY